MELLKGSYVKPVMILHVICLLSITIFKFFNITKINNFYFGGFIVMTFLMLKALKKGIDTDEAFSWATLFVWDLCYIWNDFFRFGRFFVRNL